MNDWPHMCAPLRIYLLTRKWKNYNCEMKTLSVQYTNINNVYWYVYFQFNSIHSIEIQFLNQQTTCYFGCLCLSSFLAACFDFWLYNSAIETCSWLRSSYCLIFLLKCSARLFDEAVSFPQHGPFRTWNVKMKYFPWNTALLYLQNNFFEFEPFSMAVNNNCSVNK